MEQDTQHLDATATRPLGPVPLRRRPRRPPLPRWNRPVPIKDLHSTLLIGGCLAWGWLLVVSYLLSDSLSGQELFSFTRLTPSYFLAQGFLLLIAAGLFTLVYVRQGHFPAFKIAAWQLGSTGLGLIIAGLTIAADGPLPELWPLGAFIFGSCLGFYLLYPVRVLAIISGLICVAFTLFTLVLVAYGVPWSFGPAILCLTLLGLMGLIWFGLMRASARSIPQATV